MKYNFQVLVAGTVAVLMVICGCMKELAPSENPNSITSTSDGPDVLPGQCPYPCTDIRCKAYHNGYCGSGSDTAVSLQEFGDSTSTTEDIMEAAFSTLSETVNFAELSTEMGFPGTISSANIDFAGVSLGYDANNNNPFAESLCAPFFQNRTNGSTLYGFGWISDTASFTVGLPFMVKFVVGSYFTLYDLTTGNEYTVNNYSSSDWSMTETTGSYIIGGDSNSVLRGANPLVQVGGNCTGKNVINCITDVYTNHGWLSVWAFVQTAFLPETAVVVAGSCAAINCVPHQD